MSKRRSRNRSTRSSVPYSRTSPQLLRPHQLIQSHLPPPRLLPMPVRVFFAPIPTRRKPPIPPRPTKALMSAKHVRPRSTSPITQLASGIQLPKQTLICVRRKQRRETLFAINRAGFSGSAPKRHYHRTDDSYYSC